MERSHTLYNHWAVALNAVANGWPAYSCKGNALAGVLAGLLVAGMASPDQALLAMAHSPIHGTITSIDAPMLQLHMRTDDGRRVDLAVANVDAMRAVRPGNHVRVDVDEHGIVLNITHTFSPPRPMSYSRG